MSRLVKILLGVGLVLLAAYFSLARAADDWNLENLHCLCGTGVACNIEIISDEQPDMWTDECTLD